MAEEYVIRTGVPVERRVKRTGLTATIRRMACNECVDVPGDQLSSVHGCAARARAKVTTCKNADGTVRVWRIDRPKEPLAPAKRFTMADILADTTTDIFGRPIAQASVPTPTPAPAAATPSPAANQSQAPDPDPCNIFD